ncbi:hypothetical protein BDR04DRAFT_1111413, partial [Suillus decipiens]
VRANLRYHIHLKNVTDGKPTRRRHAHMHSTELPGNDTEVAKQLETDFAFVRPLPAVSSDNLEGPELMISMLSFLDSKIFIMRKKLWIEFASARDVDGKEHVDEGLVPAAIEDEIMVTNVRLVVSSKGKREQNE